jgi:nucleolar protein 4
MKKSTENTVFVRLVPTPTHKVMRHELEDLFSQMGPIKKSSWIASNDASKGYGFVKYLSLQDAETSTKQLHNTTMKLQGKDYTLKVELASVPGKGGKPAAKPEQAQAPPKQQDHASKQDEKTDEEPIQADDEAALLKKKSRIILRNLSFYAKESHIKSIMEQNYGPVLDVHLPRVKSDLHVGFCFVTFMDPKDAQKAIKTKKVDIQKRAVNMEWSLPKKLHQQQQKELKEKKQTEKKDDDTETMNEDDDDDENDDTKKEQDQDSDDDDEDEEEDDDSEADSDQEDSEKKQDIEDDDGVKEHKTLFLRNLPFDATRHDLFQLFHKFGHIKGIYLVKDKETGMLKGTAFVVYTKAESAQRAIVHASSDATTDPASFVSQRQAATTSAPAVAAAVGAKGNSTVLLRGRQILIDLAVDKETAATFDSKEHNVIAADRRNMYLQAEARVESTSTEPGANNSDTWDELHEQDQKKRQHALKDKTTKLNSPLFFINPFRLSFRNLAKNVDEGTLQLLIEQATKKGIERNLVTAKDQIGHWRAKGEMSTRDILSKIQEVEAKNGDAVPQWEEKVNIKEYIPSVFIDREVGPTGKKDAPSRGFGFAEFKHHLHALACLRELNNNPTYSRDYVAGGKVASALKKKVKKVVKGKPAKGAGDMVGDDGRVRVPRLIVDFAVSALLCVLVSLYCR